MESTINMMLDRERIEQGNWVVKGKSKFKLISLKLSYMKKLSSMIFKILYHLILIFVIFLYGCNNLDKTKSNIEIIDLYNGVEDSDSINLSSLCSSIEYISLETNNQTLISWPEKVDICGNDIYIMDRRTHSFLRFDNNGKFLNRIEKSGKNQGEFIEIGGFSICEPSHEVFLYSRVSGGEILKFSKEGHYITTVARNTGLHIELLHHNEFVNYYPQNQLSRSEYFSIRVFDSIGNVTKRLHPNNKPRNQISQKITVLNSQMYIFQDSISFWEGQNDTIFRIGRDYTVKPRFLINYGKYKIPNSLLNDVDLFKLNISKYAHLFKFLECKNLIFFNIGINHKMKYVLYNKSTKVAINVFEKTINLVNNIDGGLPFWPDGQLADGRLYMLIDVSDLKKNIEANQINSTRLRTPYYISDNLNRIINLSKLNDNPILMIITLK